MAAPSSHSQHSRHPELPPHYSPRIQLPDDPPPAYDPPSYDDATHSSVTPLLVGLPYDYGTTRAYPAPETSSDVSSDIGETPRSLPEWVGQSLVVFVFLGIIYGFWQLVNSPLEGVPYPPGDPGGWTAGPG